ncbi:gp24 head vertex protein [Enterobacter phage CC31]|uniref:Capsid vertex protein n=1 Tax=Enterobacter phage CC31 TaxID=709484 RepID=E5DII9_9CAUD|nr:gp24 head vertex protein [Enterobacter phage CC31]ADB81674.1 gp24 head vertex protein [Enterobacter phage CC31]
MANIHDLLRESTTTTSSISARPSLVALTRATTKLIYSDIVATQRTTQPTAAFYGIKYLNPNKELTFLTGATYAGQTGTEDRKSIETLTASNKDSFGKGDLFKYDDIVYKVLVDNPFDQITETDLEVVIQISLVKLTTRLMSDAAITSKFETAGADIAEAKFQIDKWQTQVKSRKLKTSLTVELAQDLEANGFDASNFIDDLLATEMADEINKDILQSLVTVSKRYKVEGITDTGFIDLSYASAPEAGRSLYRMVCEMVSHIQRSTSFTATFAVASTRAAAVLAASGWLKHKPEDDDYLSQNAYGFLANGLPLYCDTNTPLDYVIVGVVEDIGDKEVVSSIFYAPYTEGIDLDDPEHVGAFKVIVDPESLQPSVALFVRYALSANPYTVAKDEKEARIIDGGDMDKMAGRSDLSVLLGVKLPKIIIED